jgi:acetyl-CoA carboxylase carboxyl transferase subunit alpha
MLNDIAVTIVAEQKGKTTKDNIYRNYGMPNPEGYRKALRAMKQAEKFKRPIITFIDTPGAYAGIGAEERGQGEAIARNLMEMSRLEVPVICVVIGEGSSGGALAIGVGDKIIMLENSVYSILSPEGFAAILWKDSSKVKEAADLMKITATDLKKMGVIDYIVKEPKSGAGKGLNEICTDLTKIILEQIAKLNKLPTQELIEQRYEKFRKMGQFNEV